MVGIPGTHGAPVKTAVVTGGRRGIGLAIAKEIMDAMNGYITAESTLGA